MSGTVDFWAQAASFPSSGLQNFTDDVGQQAVAGRWARAIASLCVLM